MKKRVEGSLHFDLNTREWYLFTGDDKRVYMSPGKRYRCKRPIKRDGHNIAIKEFTYFFDYPDGGYAVDVYGNRYRVLPVEARAFVCEV